MDPALDWPTRDLLIHRARTTPAATAVVTARDGQSVTYAQLETLASVTAEQFRESLGATARDEATSGERPWIGIDGQTNLRSVVALFAAWRLGATVVPLSPDQPPTDRRNRIDRLDLALVVSASTTDQTPGSEWPVLDAGEIPTSPTDAELSGPDDSAGRLGPRWSPGEMALVLFTSGTTGTPKGVRLTHGNLVASAAGSAFRLGLGTDDRWFDPLPTNHMGGLAPVVRSTLYGTTVVLQREFDAETTADALDASGATGVSLVPTQLRRLLDAGWTPSDSLRFVLLGGAPAGPGLLADCEAAGVPVCPTYGTTETASQIATATPNEASAHPESVGSPLVVADVTIVDPESGTPVGTGEVGELVVDGPTVTPGYLDDDASATAFGEYGLHTGDLAVRDEAGRLRIHGRIDDAIQTGGETVHPWRVTNVLADHSAVVDASVVGLPDAEWGERVAALVATERGAQVDGDTLREYCRGSLAPYEVPKTIRTAAVLPRTDSGTVDRGAVRDRLTE